MLSMQESHVQCVCHLCAYCGEFPWDSRTAISSLGGGIVSASYACLCVYAHLHILRVRPFSVSGDCLQGVCHLCFTMPGILGRGKIPVAESSKAFTPFEDRLRIDYSSDVTKDIFRRQK